MNKKAKKMEKQGETDVDEIKVLRTHRIGSKLYSIDKLPDEGFDVYYKRVGYIIKKKQSGDKTDLRTLITNSIIWRNNTLYGMGYPSTVLRRI